MADMNGFLKALNLMAGDANVSQMQNDGSTSKEQSVNKSVDVGLGGDELTCLIGLSSPNSVPANWVTENINGEQVSYDPLMFRRSAGGNKSANALVYCGPNVGTVHQPIGLSDYSYMFAKVGVSKVNLDRWDVSKVKNMEGMFSTCMSLLELRVNSWDVKKCRNLSHFIDSCLNLNVLQMSKWEPDNLEEIDNMFKAVDPALIPDWYDEWC